MRHSDIISLVIIWKSSQAPATVSFQTVTCMLVKIEDIYIALYHNLGIFRLSYDMPN